MVVGILLLFCLLSLFTHFFFVIFSSLACLLLHYRRTIFNRSKSAARILIFLLTILPSLVLCFDTHTHKLHMHLHVLSFSLILLYFCCIYPLFWCTTLWCNACARFTLSFQYRTTTTAICTMMHFSLLKHTRAHTHNTKLHFFSRSLSPNCTFACFGFSLWRSLQYRVVGVVVILVCCFFCLLLLLLLYVYDSTITLNNLVCCFSLSDGGCCFVPQRSSG